MTRRGRQLDLSQTTRRGGGATVGEATVGGRTVGEATVGGVSVRLERQESQKSASVSVTGSSMPPTIHLDDDDDDVRISSPRSFAEARSAVSSSRQRNRTAESRAPAELGGAEDLLELRLGPTNFTQSTSLRIHVPPRQADTSNPRNRSGTFTIDLTNPSSASYDADCILVNEFVQKKRKPAQAAAEPLPEPLKELKLTCAICMDSMKEETSTICGHIFCWGCIRAALLVQKKCPTCRQTLNQKQTHRIYISGSLRNP